MAAGDARGGLRALDDLGWVKEGAADYLEAATADYLRLTDDGKQLDRCLAVAPTWSENYRLTQQIRRGLRLRGCLTAEESCFTVHDSLRWTVQQKRNARNYAAGQSVTFNRAASGWKAGDCAEVQRAEEGEVWVIDPLGGSQRLNLRAVELFDVGSLRAIEVTVGDKLLIRANDKRRSLINGQVLTVERIEQDQSIRTREGITIPATFRQWCHGYVVTSHKAQGRTCEHVVVAAKKLDAKAAYVACSRGRLSCSVHTPDKGQLLSRFPEGSRRAALDALLPATRPTVTSSIFNRAKAWTRLVQQTVIRSAAPAHRWLERRLEEARQTVQRCREYRKFSRQRHDLAPAQEPTPAPPRAISPSSSHAQSPRQEARVHHTALDML
jgi:hypothetical protein